MAKRYHQSAKDRRDERRGEERHMRRERHDRRDERLGEERHMRHERHESRHEERREHHGYRRHHAHNLAEGERRMEERDFHMISEDHNACANMPQNVMYHPWPRGASYIDYSLDDTVRGIDRQEREDMEEMRRHLQPEKY